MNTFNTVMVVAGWVCTAVAAVVVGALAVFAVWCSWTDGRRRRAAARADAVERAARWSETLRKAATRNAEVAALEALWEMDPAERAE